MERHLQSDYRIRSIDFLRGIIMIIMALDHTRDFFHVQGLTGDPLDPDTTNAALYATRWITHLCAPTFVFLSGLSAWLQGKRKSKKELSLFLITRGGWLIVVDLLFMSLVFTADLNYSYLVLETLWSIGMGLIVLGFMIFLPFPVILITGLVIVGGHNLLDLAERSGDAPKGLWYNLLHRPTIKPIGESRNLFVLYPFLSWAGLTLLGYCAGKLYTSFDPAKRNRVLILTGTVLILLFLLLRYINVYGDPLAWKGYDTTLQTLFSFMNVQKYPPSLLFLCATIGPVLILLAFLERADGRLVKMISVYGRVPLFYFVVHFYIIHTAQIIKYLSSGHSVEEGLKGIPGLPFKFAAPGEGFSLGVTYLIWIAVVILMYPLCYWFDRWKTKNKHKGWVGYL